MKDEQKKWLRDFALKYAEIQNDFPAKAEKIAKQFGIGIIIIEQENIMERQKIFIAPNSRLLIGSDEKCDIILSEPIISR
ncbi:MAG: hypothetical protein ACM3PT_04530 [Deltaproteobacteria bacterium]